LGEDQLKEVSKNYITCSKKFPKKAMENKLGVKGRIIKKYSSKESFHIGEEWGIMAFTLVLLTGCMHTLSFTDHV
jgi:hypothetical protein